MVSARQQLCDWQHGDMAWQDRRDRDEKAYMRGGVGFGWTEGMTWHHGTTQTAFPVPAPLLPGSMLRLLLLYQPLLPIRAPSSWHGNCTGTSCASSAGAHIFFSVYSIYSGYLKPEPSPPTNLSLFLRHHMSSVMSSLLCPPSLLYASVADNGKRPSIFIGAAFEHMPVVL